MIMAIVIIMMMMMMMMMMMIEVCGYSDGDSERIQKIIVDEKILW